MPVCLDWTLLIHGTVFFLLSITVSTAVKKTSKSGCWSTSLTDSQGAETKGSDGLKLSSLTADLSKGKMPVLLNEEQRLLFDSAVTYEDDASEATLYRVILVDGFSRRNL